METVMRHTCEGLLDRGHEVRAVVASRTPDGGVERIPGPASGNTGSLRRCGSCAVLNSQPVSPSLFSAIRTEIRRFDPDIVQLHLPHPLAALATWFSMPRGEDSPRLTVWYHADITRQKFGARLLAPLTRAVLGRADGIAVSTGSLRDQSPLLRQRRGKVAVIPFGIDTEAWAPESGGRRVADGPFLFVGRLVYYKGLELLLDTLARVPRARLDVVGDGPLREILTRRAEAEDLRGRVRFVGELDDRELSRRMRSSAALVLPSLKRSETFGLVQLEAMAAGLPVVSTQLPTGVAEVNIDRETGRLVPPGDVAALAGALEEILDDPAMADAWGEAGRIRVREHFGRDRMNEVLETWYASLIAMPPRHFDGGR